VFRDIDETDRDRAAFFLADHMKMEMWSEAATDVSAQRDRLTLRNDIADADQIAALFNMKIAADRSIAVIDRNRIVRSVPSMSIVPGFHADNGAVACGADFRADRHIEVVSELLPSMMADYSTITL